MQSVPVSLKPSLEARNPNTPLLLNLSIPPISRWREYGFPLLLFALSLTTTTAIGARFMQNFHDGLPPVAQDGDLWPWPWLLQEPHRFLLGWPFSTALLAILLTHEFGHYFACRAHGVRATLPWVLPAPTLSGTAGAVIQIRGRIPNRRALMDIGAYGPISGYIASLIVVAIGFLLSRDAYLPDPLGLSRPVTLGLVRHILLVFHSDIPPFPFSLRHPVLIAGWVGLFITSLNLIPGGQLDGGHILYAISPRIHKVLRWPIATALLLCGAIFWIGWLLWALILLVPAMRHPRVPLDSVDQPGQKQQPLNLQRKLLAIVTLIIFLLTFSMQPFAGSSLVRYLHR